MKLTTVTLHINGVLKKLGSTGDIADKVAEITNDKDYVKNIICLNGSASAVPKNKIDTVFPFIEKLFLAINYLAKVWGFKINSYNIKNEVFDYLSERKISESNIFHSWDRCIRSFRKSKELGSITILEVAMDIWDGEVLQYIDYVFVPSKLIYSKALKLGFSENQVFYHPFGVDTDYFIPVNKKTHLVQFMFSGILNERKGIKELFIAWNRAELENAVLVLCGRKTPFLQKMLDEISPQNIELKGFLPWDKLKDEYNRSDVFVFPSKKEGSAKAIYEALACGLPVITTAESGSVIENSIEGYIVEQKDTDQLVEKMKLVAENEDIRRKMSISARKKAEEFTWNHYKERTIDNYMKIIEMQNER